MVKQVVIILDLEVVTFHLCAASKSSLCTPKSPRGAHCRPEGSEDPPYNTARLAPQSAGPRVATAGLTSQTGWVSPNGRGLEREEQRL